MTAKVIPLQTITKLDMPADRVLEGAKGQLQGVVIIGFEKESGNVYAASSYADGADVLWLLEACKKMLLDSFSR